MHWGLSNKEYILIFLPFFCLLALVPNFNYMTPFSIAGTTFLSCGLLVSISYFLRDIESPERLKKFVDIDQLGVFCSLFLYSLYNMSVLMPLENSMRKPRSMATVLTIGMVINGLVCFTFGFLGYNKYPESCDTVIKNLPIKEMWVVYVENYIHIYFFFKFFWWKIIRIFNFKSMQVIDPINFKLNTIESNCSW